MQHLAPHRSSPNITRSNLVQIQTTISDQPQDLSTTRPRHREVTAEGRGELPQSREVLGGDRGANSTSRAQIQMGPGSTAGSGVVPSARIRAEPEAAGDGRELRDMVTQSAVPCPSREETVESRTAVSERVS